MEYDEDVRSATIKALLSGALSGGVFGFGAKMLGGKSPAKIAELLKAAGVGAATGGSIAGGSVALGSSIMGPPDGEDPSAFAKRAGLGGAIGGGIGGAALGALAARGKIKLPKQVPEFMKTYFKNLTSEPASKALIKGALTGAVGVGIPASYYASDEGLGTDFINNEMKRRAKERMLLENA